MHIQIQRVSSKGAHCLKKKIPTWCTQSSFPLPFNNSRIQCSHTLLLLLHKTFGVSKADPLPQVFKTTTNPDWFKTLSGHCTVLAYNRLREAGTLVHRSLAHPVQPGPILGGARFLFRKVLGTSKLRARRAPSQMLRAVSKMNINGPS